MIRNPIEIKLQVHILEFSLKGHKHLVRVWSCQLQPNRHHISHFTGRPAHIRTGINCLHVLIAGLDPFARDRLTKFINFTHFPRDSLNAE